MSKTTITRSSIFLFVLIITFGAWHLTFLSQLKGTEVFPPDVFLEDVQNKTALVIVAHDDDAIGCAGTISKLTKAGWNVHFLTFYGNYRQEDNELRKREVKHVSEIQGLASIDLIDFSIQRNDTLADPWKPIPYNQFQEYMHVDSLRNIIVQAIDKYKPSVVFSLDNIIGGYGHPEHVCVSQSILDACEEGKLTEGFSVQRVYQAVFPKTLNENVLKDNPAFIAAKKIYQAEGSPQPTVEVDIFESSSEKKQVMMAFNSQKRNLRKIWPLLSVSTLDIFQSFQQGVFSRYSNSIITLL